MSGSDYGQAGLIGIGTPQANPTVEAELRILLEPRIAITTLRLTSASEDPLQRLRDYLERLGDSLTQYDTLRPAAFGFACTGSSYLAGRKGEARMTEKLQADFGYPIVTAAAAIAHVLNSLGARRIAIASPYPPSLTEAAHAYWSASGFQVAALHRIETGSHDTRSIYRLSSEDARAAVAPLGEARVDAILLSGTGLPSLPLIAESWNGPPLLSSNFCLAERLCAVIGRPGLDRTAWQSRLAAAIAPAKDHSHDQ